jgi:hypothetical protein
MADTSATQIAKLISLLPPAPTAWVQMAQSLPELSASLDDLVEQWRAEQKERGRALEDLERALADVGVDAEPHVVRYLRLSLDD